MLNSWFSHLRPAGTAKITHTNRRLRRRPLLESLESRQLMTTFTVTNTLDGGTGSLRQAIFSANAATATTNTINFDIGAGGVQSISTSSPLPTIMHAVIIDGTTQAGSQPGPRIVLEGASAGPTAAGLTLKASNSTVKGLALDGFFVAGIVVDGASHDVISGDYIGVLPGGSLAGPDYSGVVLQNGASANTIGGTTAATRDVISGNVQSGVVVTNAGTKNNVIEGDYIGTDSTGLKPLPNRAEGVDVLNGASSNTVGGPTPAARDVISGNGNFGLFIGDSGTVNNVVEGDYIGVDATGGTALGNASDGIDIVYGSSSNTIGGATAGSGNVISGNGGDGLFLADPRTNNNLVAGNLVGTDGTGVKAVPNSDIGVDIIDNASHNTVGGTTTGARNVISGNAQSGFVITDTGTMYNQVVGNFIGTDATGIKALPNGSDGVEIHFGASYNTIGGTTAAARNVISGNANAGISITDAGTMDNHVVGNFIGTDASGIKALPNASDGVDIHIGASCNTIGGTTAAARNVISGNGNFGVFIGDSGTVNNVVAGNFIGVDATGRTALYDAGDGVEIVYGSSSNTIGGTTPGAGNVISGNGGAGIFIANPGTTYNLVAGDFIGTDATGSKALANFDSGVDIFDRRIAEHGRWNDAWGPQRDLGERDRWCADRRHRDQQQLRVRRLHRYRRHGLEAAGQRPRGRLHLERCLGQCGRRGDDRDSRRHLGQQAVRRDHRRQSGQWSRQRLHRHRRHRLVAAGQRRLRRDPRRRRDR